MIKKIMMLSVVSGICASNLSAKDTSMSNISLHAAEEVKMQDKEIAERKEELERFKNKHEPSVKKAIEYHSRSAKTSTDSFLYKQGKTKTQNDNNKMLSKPSDTMPQQRLSPRNNLSTKTLNSKIININRMMHRKNQLQLGSHTIQNSNLASHINTQNAKKEHLPLTGPKEYLPLTGPKEHLPLVDKSTPNAKDTGYLLPLADKSLENYKKTDNAELKLSEEKAGDVTHEKDTESSELNTPETNTDSSELKLDETETTSSDLNTTEIDNKLSEEEKNAEAKLKAIFKKQTEYTFNDQKAAVDILNSLENKGHNLYAAYYHDICDILGVNNDKTRAKYSYDITKYSAYIDTMSKAMNADKGDKKLYAPFIRTKGTIHERALKRGSRIQLESTVKELQTTIEELNSTNEALRKEIADLLNGKANNDTNQLTVMEMLYQIIKLSGAEDQELSLTSIGKTISEIADHAIISQEQQMKIIEEKYADDSANLKDICKQLKSHFEAIKTLLESSGSYSAQDIEKILQTTNETLTKITELTSRATIEVKRLNDISISSEDKKIQKSNVNTHVNFSTIFYDAFAKSINAFNAMAKRLKQQTTKNEELESLKAKILKLKAQKAKMLQLSSGTKSHKSTQTEQ